MFSYCNWLMKESHRIIDRRICKKSVAFYREIRNFLVQALEKSELTKFLVYICSTLELFSYKMETCPKFVAFRKWTQVSILYENNSSVEHTYTRNSVGSLFSKAYTRKFLISPYKVKSVFFLAQFQNMPQLSIYYQ